MCNDWKNQGDCVEAMRIQKKKIIRYLLGVGGMLILAGCSKNEVNTTKISAENSVNQVLESQVDAASQENTKQETKRAAEEENEQIENGENAIEATVDEEAQIPEGDVDGSENIDYDLTAMNADMVYATVYQLMINPNDYIGKRIKIRGRYYATWYEPTQKYYHYIIIEDAMACCAQGLEFVWDDGSHIYPDEYPSDETEVEATGIFETYQEEGDPNLYCRLKDASFSIINDKRNS